MNFLFIYLGFQYLYSHLTITLLCMVSHLHKSQEEQSDLRDICCCVAWAARWWEGETHLNRGNAKKYSSFIRKAG